MSDLCKKYYHPYDPYPIQLQFMNALTELLTNEQYKIGLFESPTGTGKTLSLICSSMTWLRKRQLDVNNGIDSDVKTAEEDSEPEWVNQSFNDMKVKVNTDKAQLYEKKLEELSKSSIDVQSRDVKRRKKVSKKIEVEIEPDDYFAPVDYYSDSETATSSDLTEEVQLLLRKYNDRIKPMDTDSLKQRTKIIFASRTHSQLSQFSNQLSIPQFPSSLGTKVNQRLKYTPLGSRKQLCIHDKVSQLKDVTLINEACLDLQKQSESLKRCQYYPNLIKQSTEFRDRLFTNIRDIEDLPELGKQMGVCPYYSSRKAIDMAEVITLPYQLLLSPVARESIGLNLKDCIVIIDEAHNLIDTITSIFSVKVNLKEFIQCQESLKKYFTKFNKKMNGGNRINLLKLMKLVNLVCKYVTIKQNNTKIKNGDLIDIDEMFTNSTGDLLNVNKLEKYLSTSKIGYKIQGFIDKLERIETTETSTEFKSKSSTPVLFKVIEFLKAIANPSSEGKFFFESSSSSSSVSLNYMLLDPSHKFKHIVDQSKKVVLAGGTMEPMSDFTDYLFPYLSERQVMKFSCDHIIPDKNLTVFPVSGYQAQTFQFTFSQRNDIQMIKSVGEYIIRLCKDIPHGMVVFLPSYKYLQDIMEIWQKSSSILEKLNKMKKVHFEIKTSHTNELLTRYSKDVNIGNGAILFSVIGGKLSEGINFSDNLARGVLIIGLPYPNLFSGEIINKRKYIYSHTLKQTGGDTKKADQAMRIFYENLCMKAVNQCIGRSIRHIADYCTIYLLDERYSNIEIQSKLSKWIRNRLDNENNIDQGGVFEKTIKFFQTKSFQ